MYWQSLDKPFVITTFLLFVEFNSTMTLAILTEQRDLSVKVLAKAVGVNCSR
jgi:hypothetical protein